MDPSTPPCLSYKGMASVFANQRLYAEALRHCEKSLDIVLRSPKAMRSLEGDIRYNLAVLHKALGLREKMREEFERAARIFADVYRPDHPETLDAKGNAAAQK